MKKLILFIALLLGLLPGLAMAETLKIILPGGASGSYNTRFQILKDEIETVWNDDVDIIWGNNCTRTKHLLSKESNPVLTIWQVEYNLNPACDLPVEKQNIIAVETNYIRFCTSNNSGRIAEDLIRPGVSFTVGHSDPHEEYRKWFVGYNKAMNTNLKAVPYGSSGKARKGVLAGDIDFVFISPSNSNKLMSSGGKCFFSTGPIGEDKHNLPALSSVSEYEKASINQGYFYAAFNMSEDDLQKLRDLYGKIALGQNSKFTKFAGTKDINLRGNQQLSNNEMIILMKDTLKLWAE